jgi:checkpoint serine/threonine-protein kinase
VQRNIFALQQEAIAEEDENSPRVRNSPRESPRESPKEQTQVQDEGQSYRTEPNENEGYSYRTEPGAEQEQSYATEAQNDYSYRTEPEREQEQDGYQETFDDHYETYPEERPFRNQMYNRHLLTPVTERTFEHTVATAKSSRHVFGITEEDEEEEDEPRSPSRANHSGFVDTGVFDVPEGFTIARKLDEPKDTTQSSVEASGDFVTAQYKSSPKAEVYRDDKVSPVAKMEIFKDEPKASPKLPVFQDEPRASPKPAVFADQPKASPKLQVLQDKQPSPAKEQVTSSAPAPTAVEELALAPVLSDIPNPCNPVDNSVIATLLERIDPPLEAQPLIRRIDEKSGRLTALQKHAKMHARRSSSASMRQSLSPDESYPLHLGSKTYEASHKVGEGGFGSVFLVVDQALQAELDDRDDDDEDAAKLAIKVEKPANLWEAVVLLRVHERIAANLAASIIRPRGLYAYADESFLLLDYCRQGTLLDVVNKAAQWNIGPSINGPAVPDEILAIFFTIELLRLVEGLHTAGFIHGDLKIDNCLVRLDPADTWDSQYSRDGAKGWAAKGVRLIDFGRASDLSLFSAGDKQTFVADWKVDARDCVQMREGRPWSFEADYYGLASVCYCLLYGKYIGTVVENGRVKLDAPMKRVSS